MKNNRFPKATQLPSGNWRCQVMVDGKRISVTAETPMEAISQAIRIRDQNKAKSPHDRLLGEVIDEYIELREAVLSPATVKAYRAYRKKRFAPYMDRRISSLDARTLQRMVNDEARIVAPKTVKNAFALVIAALKEYDVDIAGVNLPQIPRNDRPWLTADNVRTFCDAVHGEACEIPALFALCSLRRSEIAGLDWKDIDLDTDIIHVRRSVVESEIGLVEKQTNKTASSSRDVPIIIPQLKQALKAVDQKTGKVVTTHPNTLRKQVNRICRQEGLPEVGAHGLRHSFASLCHYLKVPEMEAARIGGWSDLSTMKKIYTHLSTDQISEATNTLMRFFG